MPKIKPEKPHHETSSNGGAPKMAEHTAPVAKGHQEYEGYHDFPYHRARIAVEGKPYIQPIFNPPDEDEADLN